MNNKEKQEIYDQVQYAIKNKLHLGTEPKPSSMYGMHWEYPVEIKDNRIIMRDSDCGLSKPTIPITYERWKKRYDTYGLWRSVGLWDFTKADDPAADCIRWCHSNPNSAGRELYRLRKILKKE